MHNQKKPWIIVAAALFAVAWGGNEFTPLLVMYRNDGGYTPQIVNILLGAYVLGIIPALLIGGPMSDRFGRRPMMLPAPFLSMIGSAVLACGADNPWILFVGRVFSGIALGLVMAVGTSWIRELSMPPYEDAGVGAGARRVSSTLTAGFGLGAAVAGALAEFGPWRNVTPYAVNILLTIPAAIWLLSAPETHPRVKTDTPLLSALAVPKAKHRRFLFVVLPMAPWVFGCAASAYAILPSIMSPKTGHYAIAFSALLCLVTLATGVAIQPVIKHLDSHRDARAVGTGMGITFVGMVLSSIVAATGNIWLALVAGAVLGAAYGTLLVSGLQEIGRITGAANAAGLTAVYYSLTYLGFFIPAILAQLSGWVPYSTLFAAGAVICALCFIVVAIKWAKYLPQPRTETIDLSRMPNRASDLK